MLKGKALLVAGGLLMAAAGMALFNLGAPIKHTSAQSTNYTTNWAATKLFQIDYTNNTGSRRDTAAIGVAEWSVSGDIGATSFSETWSAPTLLPRLTAGSSCSTNGYVQTDWLLGCIMDDASWGGSHQFNLKRVNPGTVYTSGTASAVRWSGGGMYCDTTLPTVLDGCIVSNGAYGFSVVEESSGSTLSSRFHGLMMPLKWTVSGTIN